VEEILGEALKGRRHDFVLTSKVFMRMGPGVHEMGLSRTHILEACEASLRRLQTDYLDVYMCHEPDQLVPIEETLRASTTWCAKARCGTSGARTTRRGTS
jgi:aryl-alcohol dehydrogenase-like predicted oxidoreductase